MAPQATISSDAQRLKSVSGFTLMEILVAIFLLALAIVPMIDAYAPAMLSAGLEEESIVLSQRARGTMMRLVALGFARLEAHKGNPADLAALLGSAASAQEEEVTVQGKTFSPRVTIADVGGADGGLLEITVALGHATMRTLRSDY
jgi:prepilin-type N-terminal cleavage/methylation domain-containing protein